MKDLWMDPVILGAVGVIVIGFILLILALRALTQPSAPKQPIKEFDFPSFQTPEPLSVLSPERNPFSEKPAPPPAPVANRDVLEKVDVISQRLVDMQMLLNKQVTASAQAGAVNAGLSPEMLDKLLKITSTVAQQIEVLQKELGNASPVPAPPTNP